MKAAQLIHLTATLLSALFVLSLVGRVEAACSACTTTPQASADLCLKQLADKPSGCFEYAAPGCVAATAAQTVPLGAAGEPFAASCTGGKVTVTADAAKLTSLAGKAVTVTIGAQTFKATVPAPADDRSEDAASTNEASTSEEPTPIDIEPRVPTKQDIMFRDPYLDGEGADGVRYVYVHENLSVDRRSAKHVTESDRVVIRFIARKAVLCRLYAASDEKNEYKPSVGRVGGREGLTALLKNWKLVGAGDAPTKSCGEDLTPSGEEGRFLVPKVKNPAGQDAYEYEYTDFTFGPFTSEQLTFHLFRHDRQFKGNDLEAKINVANHQLYVGWADFVVVGTTLFEKNHQISVVKQNGTELTRISVSDDRQRVDLAAQIKFFAVCTNRSSRWFHPQDLQEAPACFGISSGFSVLNPTRRFYPLGVNVTLGRYLSINAMSVLQRSAELASGYVVGDLFSGPAADVPKHERLVLGAGLGVGLDPALVGDLIGGIVKAGL